MCVCMCVCVPMLLYGLVARRVLQHAGTRFCHAGGACAPRTAHHPSRPSRRPPPPHPTPPHMVSPQIDSDWNSASLLVLHCRTPRTAGLDRSPSASSSNSSTAPSAAAAASSSPGGKLSTMSTVTPSPSLALTVVARLSSARLAAPPGREPDDFHTLELHCRRGNTLSLWCVVWCSEGAGVATGGVLLLPASWCRGKEKGEVFMCYNGKLLGTCISNHFHVPCCRSDGRVVFASVDVRRALGLAQQRTAGPAAAGLRAAAASPLTGPLGLGVGSARMDFRCWRVASLAASGAAGPLAARGMHAALAAAEVGDAERAGAWGGVGEWGATGGGRRCEEEEEEEEMAAAGWGSEDGGGQGQEGSRRWRDVDEGGSGCGYGHSSDRYDRGGGGGGGGGGRWAREAGGRGRGGYGHAHEEGDDGDEEGHEFRPPAGESNPTMNYPRSSGDPGSRERGACKRAGACTLAHLVPC